MKPHDKVFNRRKMLAGTALGATALLLPRHAASAATLDRGMRGLDGVGRAPVGALAGWKGRPDLLPDVGSCVFGAFAGTGETIEGIEALGVDIGLTTIYWKQLKSPASIVNDNLKKGIITRVELELTSAFTDAGEPVKDLWTRIAAGTYDAQLKQLLVGIGPLASICHEADLAPGEQGGVGTQIAGTPTEYAAMWRHVVTVARGLGATTRWFFDMSFSVKRWGENLTAEGSTGMYPGHRYVDFVGWDGFDWVNVPLHKPPAANRTSFGSMMGQFGRWDWYTSNFGQRGDANWKPLMIGETACSAAAAPVQPADAWMDDMRTWLHAHPAVTHVIWFSVKYPDHDRRLTGDAQTQAGTRRIASDVLFV